MRSHTFQIIVNQAEFLFHPDTGGFPSSITAKYPDGTLKTLVKLQQSPFSILVGEQTYKPRCDASTPVLRYRRGSSVVVEYARIPWFNSKHEPLDDLYLSLKWEIHQDGAVFCDMFLFYATIHVPKIRDFKINIPLDFCGFDDVRWSLIQHPEKVDATIIQAAPPERFLDRKQSRIFKQGLFAQAGFYAAKNHGKALYCEFFLEGNNSLFNRSLSDTASSVLNSDNGFSLTWNFQTQPAECNGRPLHWRNRFGFLVRPPQTKRRHPPLTMYQYIDNFDRMPSPQQIRALAEAGAQILILHDCWRFDTQNGGIPYDYKKFRAAIKQLHANKIRVVLYARGNEISIREDAASWFDTWLIKDYDGLYLDYGGPLGYSEAPSENFPGGRIAFHEYYQCMAAVRERVGDKGLLFFHTGTNYSGLASSFMDGYTSGEGERGILIKGHRENEYFSMAAVSPGCMWTAAFPEYSSEKMTPFLASSGQTPHLPIGKQIASSSLHHPPIPGFNDRHFQKLLYTWRLLPADSPCHCYNDYNSENIFAETDPPAAAHCLMLSGGKKQYGVFLLANCSGHPITASYSLAAPFDKFRLFRIPGYPEPAVKQTLQAWEVTASLVAEEPATAESVLKKHLHIPPSLSGKIAVEYQRELKRQQELRNLPAEKDFHIRFFLPSRITSHEQSLWDDLYDIIAELRVKQPDGQYQSLGFVSKEGLSKKYPPETLRIRPGLRSKAISIRKLLGAGRHDLELISSQHGNSFYSFFAVEICPGGLLEFHNELEPDRARLHWTCSICE